MYQEVDVASYDGKVASIAALKNKSASVLKEEEAVCIEAEKRFWDADRRLKAQVDSDMTLKVCKLLLPRQHYACVVGV